MVLVGSVGGRVQDARVDDYQRWLATEAFGEQVVDPIGHIGSAAFANAERSRNDLASTWTRRATRDGFEQH